MRTLVFQHTAEEAPGTLLEWLHSRGHSSHVHLWHLGGLPPAPESFDFLAVLGGPMNVDEEDKFPWLRTEKSFLHAWLATGKPCLGLCLGGQLMAQALNARVERSDRREVGFWSVVRTGESHPALRRWPQEAVVYQFHQDRFQLPAGCLSLLTSPACPHQAFAQGRNILGLQFHPESTAEWVAGNAGSVNRIEGELFVQSPEETARLAPGALPTLRALFFQLLDDFQSGWA